MIYRKYSFYGGYCLILPEFWCACDRKIMAKALEEYEKLKAEGWVEMDSSE